MRNRQRVNSGGLLLRSASFVLGITLMAAPLAVTSAAVAAPGGVGRSAVPVSQASADSARAARLAVRGLSPNTGPASGGNRVEIRGSGFVRVRSVLFGKTHARGVKVVSPSLIVVTAPRGRLGAVAVTVRTRRGTTTRKAAYRYLPRPVVSRLSASHGPLLGGQTLVIQGRNFARGATVAFGDVAAPRARVLSPSKIRVAVPTSWPTTAAVRVTTRGGTSALTGRSRYTYDKPPAADSAVITPKAGTYVVDPAKVASVTGGANTRSGTALQISPWVVTLAPGTSTPSVGQPFLLKPGSSTYPSGLAGTVSSLGSNSGAPVVTVAVAPLRDVLSSATATYSGSLPNFARRGMSGRLARAATDQVSFGSISFGAFDCSANGAAVHPGGKVSLEVTNIQPVFYFDSGSLFNAPRLDVYVTYQTKVTVEAAHVDAAGAKCELSPEFQDTHKQYFFGADGASFTMAPSVSFELSAGGSVELSQVSNHMGGFEYANGKLSQIRADGAQPVQIEGSASLSAEAFGGIEIQVGWLDRVGIGVDAGAGLSAELKIKVVPQPTTVCASADAYLKLSVYAYLDVFIEKWTYQFFEGKIPVAHVDNGCDPPYEPAADPSTTTPTIVTSSLPDGTVGQTYSARLQTADNRQGSWSVSSGTLPSGLTLNGDTISGTPTAAGSSSFTVTFQDAYGYSTQGQFSIVVGSASAVTPTGGPTGGTTGAWSSISAGGTSYSAHTCGIKADGSAWCWGDNSSGELGPNGGNVGVSGASNPTPAQIPGAWSSISAGPRHTCGIKADGSAWCWGSNGFGELGPNGGTGGPTPAQVPGTWSSISAGGGGGEHTCGIKTDGTAWCWGDSYYGELGPNGGAGGPTPAQVPGTWSSISAGGDDFTCGIKTDGSAWCWGYNYYGELGPNGANSATTSPNPAPAQVPGTWSSISAGGDFTCGIKADGSAWCWGFSYNGALGPNTNYSAGDPAVSPPAQVPGTWSSISAGDAYTCGVKADGSTWCWGDNSNGQLGPNGANSGTTSPNPAPVQVPGTWSSISAGYEFTCGIKTDGSAWCWGSNSNGQLGPNGANSGTTNANPTPAQVAG